MRAVVQRVRDCAVSVAGAERGRIAAGLLVYLGVGREDTERDLEYLADKVANLRIFQDENGKMNRSVLEVERSVLVVSQFTLYGDARAGRRPSYTAAAQPEVAREMYEGFLQRLRGLGLQVQTGEFAARMEVRYVNEGPVTILLDSQRQF
ncbi:MAG: D-tyrosyl-tRNA(Tyr) deacylase [Spirochaetales bacterium]|nr:D-tyrosyl-tRNA(Tyr) deacylase [Spirochaetales bacterium]